MLQLERSRADKGASMRTLGFRTQALVALAAAVGMILTLSRPWYAPAPAPAEKEAAIGDLHGPVDQLAETVARWAGETTGTSGWAALGTWGTVLAVLAALAGLGALGCLVPSLQGIAREALRYGGFACLAIVVWKLLDSPGANDALELRYGAFVAATAAVVMVTSGGPVAGAPMQRRRSS
jgi:hypothetical protein